MPENDFEERKSLRVRYPLMVEYKIIKGGEREKISKPIDGQVRDISLGGICLQTNVLEMDGLHIYHNSNNPYQNLLEIDIDLPFDYGNIKVIGKVAWYDLAKRRGRYQFDIGVVFLEIGEKDKENLIRFLNKEN